jgi:hypothetical protein
MSKTFKYSISLAAFLTILYCQVNAQDTITYPLRINVGFEASGPIIYYTNKNLQSLEGYVSLDLNEKRSVNMNIGFLNYKYSQYNYSYLNKGSFVRVGMDFNLLKPEKSKGKYWAGIGLRYGISRYNSETPVLSKENYWGLTSSSVPVRKNWGHFIEVDPGVRADMFKYFSMGWTMSLRMLVHAGGSKDLRPIYLPGFGNATKTISAGLSYFLVWNIPYKKITVIPKTEEPEEPDEEDDAIKNNNGSNSNSGNSVRPGMRQ